MSDRLFSLVLCLITLWSTAYAQEDTSPYSNVSLISESAWIQPGETFTLGLHLIMDEGWHSYWINPGDSGEPTEITWILPEGFTAGSAQWPYPERIDTGPLRTYGYSDEVLLIADISPPANLTAGTSIALTANVFWLICDKICIPVEETVSLSLPVQKAEPPAGAHAEIFAEVRKNHPVRLPNWSFEATYDAKEYVLRVKPPTSVNPKGAYFFAFDPNTLEHASAQPVRSDGDSFLLTLERSSYAKGTAQNLQGILVAGEGKTWGDNVSALEVTATVQEAEPTAATPSLFSFMGLLLLAGIGGLLLNLMPCVFPVLSITILGLTTHTRNHVRHGAVFASGIMVSFWILAGLLLVFRAAGHQIGWGFQLQSPLIVALLALLIFAIGLNLIGVFEISTLSIPQRTKATEQTGYMQSLHSGVLATVVATPCTAPFMGAALGAGIVLPTVQAFLIFTALAAGMALPYIVLSMMPGLTKKLPKPGPWMEILKQLLAIPMLATTIWLIWVFGKQTGIDGVALLLLSLLLLSFALWVLGRWPGIQISKRVHLITRGVATSAVLTSLLLLYAGATTEGPITADTTNTSWQEFSPEKIETLRAEGQPVFIDFTAAWCLTCQFNKRTTLGSVTIREAFERKGVHLFRADWTNRDATITRALAAYGRNGVPLYILYTGMQENAVILPEVLTKTIVLDVLEPIPDALLISLQQPYNSEP